MIRKIHLDFHTPGYIQGVASETDPAAFAATLAEARVTDIVIFAKDCYGLTFFPTKVGTVHPGLTRPNMLGDLVAACTARGIRVQAYFTLGIDPAAALEHPEWRQQLPNGQFMTWGPATPLMEFAGSYLDDMVLPQVDEVLDAAPSICGFWFDICLYVNGAYYSEAFENYALAHAGPNADMATRKRLAVQVLEETATRLNAQIARRLPEAENYYNSLVTPGGGERAIHESATEVEAPPFFVSNDDMPVQLRYLRTLDTPTIGLTSRFQYPWTDIGSLRTHDQLLFDAASVVAAGADISIGDHGHPYGRLEPLVYQRIGDIYRYLEQLAPWIDGMRPTAEAAVLTTWGDPPECTFGEVPANAKCAVRMLCELGVQTDLIGPDDELERYRLLVWPGDVPADAALSTRLRAYLAQGGRLIATGLAWQGLEALFGIDNVLPGRKPVDDAHWGEYVRPTAELPGLEPWAQVSYGRLWLPTPLVGTAVLAERLPSLAPERAPDALGGNPPAPGRQVEGAVITQVGNAIYSGMPIFANFQAHGNAVYRDYLLALLERLLPDRLVRHDGGPNVEVSMHAGEKGHVLHFVQWSSERWPARHLYPAQAPRLAPVNVRVRAPQPSTVISLPDNTPLPYTYADGVISCASPAFTVHQAIAFLK